MNDIEVSSIDLVEGGNVFKQGHYLTLGYVPRDEKGETVDLSGKTLNVSLWGRKGVVFEAAATYSGGVIRFTLDKMVPAGDYTVEFTVTSSTDAKYRKKFPTNQHSGRITIKQSADDLGVVGIQVYTVAQLKAEQKALLDAAVSNFTVDSETQMARVSDDKTYTSLRARLEGDKQETAQQLAEKVGGANKATMDNLGQDVKEALTGGAVAVVGTGAVGTINMQKKSVTPEKTTFLTAGKNLFDKSDVKIGYRFQAGTGKEIHEPAGQWSITGFIPVKPLSVYIRSTNGTALSNSLVFYDTSYNVILMQEPGAVVGAFTTPAECYYIRSTITTLTIDQLQIEEGDSITPYENYKILLKENVSPSQSFSEGLITDNQLVLEPGKNLFDYTATLKNSEIYADGTFNTRSASEQTDYLDVRKFNNLYLSGLPIYTEGSDPKAFFYDGDKNPIGVAISRLKTASEISISVPVNAVWFATSIYQRKTSSEPIDTTTVQIEGGTKKTPFESFELNLSGIKEFSIVPKQEENNLPTKGKTMLIFGDSNIETATLSDDGSTYTENTRQNWPTYSKNTLELGQLWNYAKSGASYKDGAQVEIRQKLSHQITTAIANGRDADIVVVSAGGNDGDLLPGDYQTAMSKGSLEELDRTKLYEAIRWAFWTIKTNYPEAACYVATPTQRTKNDILPILRDAIIRMAHRYNFIIIDAEVESGIVREFEVSGGSGRYLYDGLHQNEAGRRMVSRLADRVILNTYRP